VIGLDTKTDVERQRISNAPVAKEVLLEHGSQLVDNVSIERVELRQYWEKLDKERGFYSLITVYLKTSKGEIELKFDEGFKGKDPLPAISLTLVRYVGLKSLINRALIAFNET
jgi:hypothetical protein